MLPFVTMWPYAAAEMQEGVQMSHLVQQNHKEHVRVQVAVDADSMVVVRRVRPVVVAQLGASLPGDMKVNSVGIQIAVHLLYCTRRQVASEYKFPLRSFVGW